MTVHQMISESKALCGRLVTQGTGRECGNCARVAKSREMMSGEYTVGGDVSRKSLHNDHLAGPREVVDAERIKRKSDGRIGRVVGVYGPVSEATKVAVAWDADADTTTHYAIAAATEESVGDLVPVVNLRPGVSLEEYEAAHAETIAAARAMADCDCPEVTNDAPAPRKLRKRKSTRAIRARRGGAR